MNKLEQRFPRYSKLLSLYPSNYRQNYGEQMLQTLADMLDDPERSKTAVWSRLTLDFPLSLLKQQLIYTGEVMAMDTPYYVKRSAVVGSALVAPFFIFLALNGIMHNRLQHSWVWNSWFLFVWLILLPAIAALANIQALVRSRQAAGTAQNKRAVGVTARSSWPALTILLVSLGILGIVFFHDSVHCVTGNPYRELHNWHATWQCIQNGTV